MANSKIEGAVSKKNVSKLIKFAQGRDVALRLEAIESMGRLDNEETFNFLTGALRSPDAQIRAAAATGLGTMKNGKARAFLEHQMKNEQDENVASKIKEALSYIRTT